MDDENGYTVTGNGCPRGAEYGKKELTAPTRVITSTVRVTGGLYKRCPVKTDKPIPKELIFDAMKLLNDVDLVAPVKVGQVIIENVLGTGANFVTARNL